MGGCPLGQRETQRPVGRNRMVNPAKVSCAKLDRSLPIFKAIGTKDPVGVLEAVSQRAVAMLDNTIADMSRIRGRVRAGEPLAWPLIGDLLAWSLKTRMLMRVNDPKAWTGKGTARDRRTAELIIRWLSNIRKIIAGGHLRYTCLASSHCGPSTWAWVFCDKYRINLCRRFWRPKAGINAVTHFEFQAQTIIHEASHIYYCTEDTGMGPGAAECISQFVADANGSPIDEDFVGRCGPKEPTLP
jgi:Lysine-specific metallo-endopeptidase